MDIVAARRDFIGMSTSAKVFISSLNKHAIQVVGVVWITTQDVSLVTPLIFENS
jgi:hypothetical protein